ncbi:MAG: hypothetical protein JNM36_05180 [Chitinophagales bacterium]|jgi:cell division protein FtsQ|nr:hypothetical protein [Chitinophagales bacterium]
MLTQTRKPFLVGLFWFLVTLFGLLLLRQAYFWQQNSYVDTIVVSINDSNEDNSVSQEEIKNLVLSQLPSKTLNGMTVAMLDRKKIEDFLEMNPYIANAAIYTDMRHQLRVDIDQRYPILRIVPRNGKGFYLSKEGKKMPANGLFSARVPVATGYIVPNTTQTDTSQSPITQSLFELATFLTNDPFWYANTEQIYVNPKGDLILIPKIASHEIILGNTTNLPDKFNRLTTFYQDALNRLGWNKYKTISVKYQGQIVCR